MLDRDLDFLVDARVTQLGIPLAAALICGLDNGPREADSPRLGPDAFGEFGGFGGSPWCDFSSAFLEHNPVLRGYRSLHTAVGRSNKRFVSSTEALVRGFMRTGSLPRINTAVGLYNRLSLETLLSIGAHDARKFSGDLSFRLTDGSERFVPLGREEPVPIPPGEYGTVDGDNDLVCRMECRQADKSKLDAGSTDCVFIVQGNASTPGIDVQRTLDVLVERVRARCGGRVRPLHRAIA